MCELERFNTMVKTHPRRNKKAGGRYNPSWWREPPDRIRIQLNRALPDTASSSVQLKLCKIARQFYLSIILVLARPGLTLYDKARFHSEHYIERDHCLDH